MFNNYPYTDYHELNTDWIISKIKNVETAEANTKQYAEDADAAKIAAEDARDIAVQAKDDAIEAKDDAVEAKDDAISFLTGTKDQLDLLQARVDNIIPDGTQTAGNTELIDIRVAYDGTTYTSAGDAVRGQAQYLYDGLQAISDPLSDYVELSLTKTDGYYYKTDGTTISNNAYECAVVEYDGYSAMRITTNGTSVAQVALFFSGVPDPSTYIGAQPAVYPPGYGTLSVTDLDLVIPANTMYIVINNQKAVGPMIVKKYTTESINLKLNYLKDEIDTIDDGIKQYINITGSLTIEDGYYYNAAGIHTSHADYENTIIAVNQYDDFKITCSGTSVCPCISYYNDTPSSASLISYEPTVYPPDYTPLTISDYVPTIPSGAVYMVVNNRKPSTEMFVYKYEVPSVTGTMLSYQNKNILLLGDSITQLGMSNRGWPKYFSRVVKPARIDNVAVIGAHMCDYNDSTVYDGDPQPATDPQNVVGNQVQKIINNPSDYASSYDVIIIAAGTNDTTSSGSLTDAQINAQFFGVSDVLPLTDVDRSTWPGATRWITEQLRSLFPTAIIVFSTPIHRMGMLSCDRVINNAAVIRACAEANSALLCDTIDCGISMTDSNNFVDGLHPSAAGAKLIARYITKFFTQQFSGYLDE